MNAEFFNALEQLGKEKNIPGEMIMERVETALTNAYKREHNGCGNVRIVLDPVKKDVKMYEVRSIVEEVTDPDTEISLVDAKKHSSRNKLGGICEIEISPKKFSRISAQTAKQVIIQGIREAERGLLIAQYEDKKESIITATVYKTDMANGSVIVDTGISRVSLIKDEQIPGEVLTEGKKIKLYVVDVRKETRGPLISVSRTHPGLVKRLFELEVPEIQDGTVVIESIAREAGSRTKIAVSARDEFVDPIGACIGNKRARINSITDELNNEKIDIINYSENPEEFIAAALAPATVKSVVIEPDEKTARVYVDADQLSLAIGKEGQNVRLAVRLTGFKIDIANNSHTDN